MPSFIPKPAWPLLQRVDPLARGLVGAWPFFEGSGKAIRDLSGNHNDGAFVADTTLATWSGGNFGNSVAYTSAGRNTISVASASILTPVAITIGVLFSFRTLGVDNILLIKGNTNGPTTGSYWLRKQADNTLQFFLSLNSANVNLTSTVTITDFNTHYIAGTYDGAKMILYLDGKQIAQSNQTGSITANALALQLGPDQLAGFGFANGNCSEAHIYNRPLSAGEIAQRYQDPFRIYRPRSRWWETVRASSGIRRVIRAGILRLGQLLNH